MDEFVLLLLPIMMGSTGSFFFIILFIVRSLSHAHVSLERKSVCKINAKIISEIAFRIESFVRKEAD
jgi:hypothetical protein